MSNKIKLFLTNQHNSDICFVKYLVTQEATIKICEEYLDFIDGQIFNIPPFLPNQLNALSKFNAFITEDEASNSLKKESSDKYIMLFFLGAQTSINEIVKSARYVITNDSVIKICNEDLHKTKDDLFLISKYLPNSINSINAHSAFFSEKDALTVALKRQKNIVLAAKRSFNAETEKLEELTKEIEKKVI